ncbi:MAG: DUF554 domain-containing protein [Candidatus Izemoplasmataceae bacterium]
MVGVVVNSLAIVIGGLIGLVLKHGLSERLKVVVMQGIGLSVIVIGLAGALKSNSTLLLVMSLAIGGLVGSLLQIEYRLDLLGLKIEKRFKGKEEGSFAKGFVTASLVYCVGAMAIVGSIEAGVSGNYDTLYVKSLLDGVTAIVFAATLGFGVLFSSVSVFLYQGVIVVLGILLGNYMPDMLIVEMSAVGSVLIMAIGINILEIKRIHVGDLLPAVLVPIVYYLLLYLF